MKKVISAKEARAAGEKLSKDIYFHKRKRGKIKKDFLRLQKSLITSVDTREKPITVEEYDQRHLELSMADISVAILYKIEEAEKWDKEITLSNCKFKLYKKDKSIVFQAKFKKPLLGNSIRTTYLYLPQGLPKNNKKKAYKIKEKFDLKGYKQIDSGKFIQKIIDFKTMSLDFIGREKEIYLICKLINDEKQTLWITLN